MCVSLYTVDFTLHIYSPVGVGRNFLKYSDNSLGEGYDKVVIYILKGLGIARGFNDKFGVRGTMGR